MLENIGDTVVLDRQLDRTSVIVGTDVGEERNIKIFTNNVKFSQ